MRTLPRRDGLEDIGRCEILPARSCRPTYDNTKHIPHDTPKKDRVEIGEWQFEWIGRPGRRRARRLRSLEDESVETEVSRRSSVAVRGERQTRGLARQRTTDRAGARLDSVFSGVPSAQYSYSYSCSYSSCFKRSTFARTRKSKSRSRSKPVGWAKSSRPTICGCPDGGPRRLGPPYGLTL